MISSFLPIHHVGTSYMPLLPLFYSSTLSCNFGTHYAEADVLDLPDLDWYTMLKREVLEELCSLL